MNKTTIRNVALLLVPCLIGDPTLAAISAAPVPVVSGHTNLFREQALSPKTYGAQHYGHDGYMYTRQRIATVLALLALLPAQLGVLSARQARNTTPQNVQLATRSVDALINVLMGPYEKARVLEALRALGNLGDRRAIPAIKSLLTVKDDEIRIWAFTVLFQLGDCEPLVTALRQKVVYGTPALSFLAKTPFPTVFRSSAEWIAAFQQVARDETFGSPNRAAAIIGLNRFQATMPPEEAARLHGLGGVARDIFLRYGLKVYGARPDLLNMLLPYLEPLEALLDFLPPRTLVFASRQSLYAEGYSARNVDDVAFIPNEPVPTERFTFYPQLFPWLHEIGHSINRPERNTSVAPAPDIVRARQAFLKNQRPFLDLELTDQSGRNSTFDEAFGNALSAWVFEPEKFFLISDIDPGLAVMIQTVANKAIRVRNGERAIPLFWPKALSTPDNFYRFVPVPNGEISFAQLVELYLNALPIAKQDAAIVPPTPEVLKVQRLTEFLYERPVDASFLPYLGMSAVLNRHPLHPSLRGPLSQLEAARQKAAGLNSNADRAIAWLHFVNGISLTRVKKDIQRNWILLGIKYERHLWEVLESDIVRAFGDVLKVLPPRESTPAVEAQREFVRGLLLDAGLGDVIPSEAVIRPKLSLNPFSKLIDKEHTAARDLMGKPLMGHDARFMSGPKKTEKKRITTSPADPSSDLSAVPQYPMLGSTLPGVEPLAIDVNTRAAWERLARFLVVDDPLPARADGMIVFGGDMLQVARSAARLTLKIPIGLAVPAGGRGRLTPPDWNSEGEKFAEIMSEIAPALSIFPETRSTYTKENTEFAWKILRETLGHVDALICLQIPILSLRARKTLERTLQESHLPRDQWPVIYFHPAFETRLEPPPTGWPANGLWAQRQLFEAMSQISGLLGNQNLQNPTVAFTEIPASLMEDALTLGDHLLKDPSIRPSDIQTVRDRMAQIQRYLEPWKQFSRMIEGWIDRFDPTWKSIKTEWRTLHRQREPGGLFAIPWMELVSRHVFQSQNEFQRDMDNFQSFLGRFREMGLWDPRQSLFHENIPSLNGDLIFLAREGLPPADQETQDRQFRIELAHFMLTHLSYLALDVLVREPPDAEAKFMRIQSLLDKLNSRLQGHTPVLVHDISFLTLLPLSQPFSNELNALKLWRNTDDLLTPARRLQLHAADAQLVGAHLRATLYNMERSNMEWPLSRMREQDVADYPVLAADLAIVLKAYREAVQAGDEKQRKNLAEIFLGGVSGDPSV